MSDPATAPVTIPIVFDPETAEEAPRSGTGSRGGLVSDARGMAIATLVSRGTGFARVAALTAVLGIGSLRQAFALRDTKTPALVQCAVSAILVGVDLLLAAMLPAHLRVFGLAAGHACAYLAGVLISAAALRRRLGPRSRRDTQARILPLLGRLAPAASTAGAAAAGVAAVMHQHLSAGWGGDLLVLTAAGTLGLLVYIAGIIVMRVPEALAGVNALRARARVR